MLFAAILLSLASVGMSQAPTPYIDYLSCTWEYGPEGEDVECAEGFIGIGACGSDSSTGCNTHAAGIQCCRIKDDDIQANCAWTAGASGEHIVCPVGELEHGTCGSGAGRGTCVDDGDIAIQCCESSVEAIRSANCGWLYGASGDNVSCGVNQVLVGQCGSYTTECIRGTEHGVYCCDIIVRDG